MNKGKTVVQYIILSILAVCLILILTYFSSQKTVDYYNKMIVGGMYISCCIFGISLALRPRLFKKNINHTIDVLQEKESIQKKLKIKGHHPVCKQFINHTITINKKTYCAGCFGLALGGIISTILMIIYIFYIDFVSSSNILFFPIVFILITLIYLELLIIKRHPLLHIVSNILLIICFFIITISILEITGDVRNSLIGILLSFLWLDTRIQLSKWKHTRICLKCKNPCKMYI
jgi:hypothetical protein